MKTEHPFLTETKIALNNLFSCADKLHDEKIIDWEVDAKLFHLIAQINDILIDCDQ